MEDSSVGDAEGDGVSREAWLAVLSCRVCCRLADE